MARLPYSDPRRAVYYQESRHYSFSSRNRGKFASDTWFEEDNQMSNTNIVILAILSVAISASVLYFANVGTKASPEESKELVGGLFILNINNKAIELELADTDDKREKGLSNHESLKNDTGMLFVFDEPGKYGFWMEGMKFSIDIVWLDSLKKVIHIEKNVSPDSYPDVFFPPEDSLYALEFNAGFVDENNIAVGNILDIPKK